MPALRRLALLALGVAACLSPTLPLPPPDAPDSIAEDADGAWELRGGCLAGAEIIAVNQRTGRGAVFVDQKRTGRYVVVIEGEPCDVAILSQLAGDEGSADTRVVLREVSGGVEKDPSACSP